jgi:hypothetical protein
MAGWLTDGVPQITTAFGAETLNLDTNIANGSNPQTGSVNFAQLANYMSFFNQTGNKTLVAGSLYYSSYVVGNAYTATGCSVLVGATGGTDYWSVQLFNAAGTLLARSSVSSATLAGTASTWQQIAFTATYNILTPGTYFLGLSTNGTTATLGTINSPTNTGVITGSQTGTYSSPASITSPATTYTANLGPKIMLY